MKGLAKKSRKRPVKKAKNRKRSVRKGRKKTTMKTRLGITQLTPKEAIRLY
jgi:hypothetical protein